MTSALKQVFSKRNFIEISSQDDKVFRSDVTQYDATFAIPKAVLKLVGVRFMHSDSHTARLLWNIFYWFEFFNMFCGFSLELIFMMEVAKGGSFQDAIAIFKMMPCIGYVLLAMAKSYKMVYQRALFENLVSELRVMWPQGQVTYEEHSVMTAALRRINYVAKVYYWSNHILLLIFLSPPFVDLVKHLLGYDNPLTLAFFYWFPFDPAESSFYGIILIVQNWQAIITIWFMLVGDLLFCVFITHITIQLDLLSLRIKRLVRVPADRQLPLTYPLAQTSEKYFDDSKDESHRLKQWETKHQHELTNIILKHHALIRLSRDVEEMYSFALLVNFFNSSIIICFCGFCCVVVEKWNEIIYKLFLGTALMQTWLFCWYGQRLVDSSKGVSDALYNSGWYQASRQVKSSILVMLLRTQKVVYITTYGFSVISLSTYTTIIKSSWSYFTLLLNVYRK